MDYIDKLKADKEELIRISEENNEVIEAKKRQNIFIKKRIKLIVEEMSCEIELNATDQEVKADQ
jgi:hypothetical protein